MKSKSLITKNLGLLIILILILGSVVTFLPAKAQTTDTIYSGYGTATIDGYFGPDEWEHAKIISFEAKIPSHDGGGTIPAELYIMNDDDHLYLGIKIGRSPFGNFTNPMFRLDLNNNNVSDDGDEYIGATASDIRPLRLIDGFFTTSSTGAVQGLLDAPNGGTTDLQAAALHDGIYTYIEMFHPLDSADDLHDMSLSPGAILGIQLNHLRLSNINPSCSQGCLADTDFPTNGFLPIKLASLNQPPVANANGPLTGNEGAYIDLDATSSTDPDGDPLTFSWSVDSGLCTFDDVTSAKPLLRCEDNSDFTATVVVHDGQAKDSDTVDVEVLNTAPSIGSFSVNPTIAPVGALIEIDADFFDYGQADTHTAEWNWGDGITSSPVKFTQEPGSGEAFGEHIYSTAGVYTITLTVTDDDGGSGASEYQNLIIYDPDGGFVSGGGWIWSFPGTYITEPDVTGWANFGFVAKYHKGAEVPDGQAELVYHTAGMNFHSTEYDWLVVTGGDTAKFKGSGTINGEGDYKFMIWAADSEPDTFRIKIWEETNGEEAVIYDNSLGHPDYENGQPIGKGSILVHSANTPVKETLGQIHKGFMLGNWFDADDIRWQEFLPTYDNLSSIEIYLGRDGNPGNVLVEIRTLDDTVLASNVLNEADIHRYGWVRIEYPQPLSLTPGTKYRIYVYADQVSTTPENRYFWFGDRDSPYDSDCETDLSYFMPDFDYAFKTYAITN